MSLRSLGMVFQFCAARYENAECQKGLVQNGIVQPPLVTALVDRF